MDELYHGTATDYINQFWSSDGKDIDLIGLQLFQGIKDATESLKSVKEEHSDWEDVNAAHGECKEDRKMYEMKNEKDYSAKECKESMDRHRSGDNDIMEHEFVESIERKRINSYFQ